jgi:DNA primase
MRATVAFAAVARSPAVELEVGGRTVRVSNPDKIYFPEREITKRQVVEHYLAVAEPLLGVLRDRPTHLRRYVDGVTGEWFYQKRLAKGAPDYVETVQVRFPSGRPADVLCPDELRIDLDPQPGTDFADAARVAATLREVLTDAGLVGWPKTSGGRGIHVMVPIRSEWDFVAVRRCVIAIGREVCRRLPSEATVDWWKEERGERVFLDFNQAARDRTIASAWSVRGTPRATVSFPLRWEELPDAEPDDFDVLTAAGLHTERGDAHAGWRRRWSGSSATSVTTGWATCPTRRSTRRCPASRSGSSRARRGPTPRASRPDVRRRPTRPRSGRGRRVTLGPARPERHTTSDVCTLYCEAR